MIRDSQASFSASQSLIGTASAVSTDVIDVQSMGLGAGPQVGPNALLELGGGQTLYLVVQMATTAAGTATSMTATLESSSTADLATSPVVHLSTGAMPIAGLTSGAMVFAMPIPPGAYRRYLGVRYTMNGGTFTAGAVSTYLTPEPQRTRSYKSAFAVQ